MSLALKVEVELGGTYIYDYGGRLHSLDLPEGATVENALDALGIKERIYIVIIRNGKAAKPEDELHDGDRLVVFPPIGGG